jgi:aspartyl-tRNA(Asn)/glutamyl-tRNA(Gln) amidotransferase subunit B
LVADAPVAAYYEATVAAAAGQGVEAATVNNWVSGELFRLLNEAGYEIDDSPVPPEALADLLVQVERGVIHANAGKKVLAEMFATGKPAREIIQAQGLAQISDREALGAMVMDAIQGNPGPLQQYLDGKDSVLGFFVGQVMRASRGKANPHLVREMLKERLDALRLQMQGE